MGDKTKGLYGKFTVTRTDRKDAAGEKHHGCQYFVLDITHDPFALPALKAYAEACKAEYPLLARDIENTIAERKDAAPCLHCGAVDEYEAGSLCRREKGDINAECHGSEIWP